MSASSNCGAPSSSGEGAQEGSDISLSVLPKPERHTVYSVEPDEESCAVCFSGVTYEGSNNEILFCDGCDTAYHQQCYSVQTLPGEDKTNGFAMSVYLSVARMLCVRYAPKGVLA